MANPKRARSGKPRTQPRGCTYVGPGVLENALERVRQAARRDKELRFTALWHHVYHPQQLGSAQLAIKRDAAPGVDGETWKQFEENAEERLWDLSERLQRGAYRPKPVRRVHIPKPDWRQRPLGVTALEDKIVQRATVEVLNAVYEEDFLGFSYGYRPSRTAHNALDALAVGIMRKKVNWVLDADIRDCFGTIDHEWLIKFVEHRIADRRVVRHIEKWLHAGVLEEGAWTQSEEGVPQGGSISPRLANIYLHYVFDLWAAHWRKHESRGDMIIVRYADDFVVGFQNRDDAQRFLRMVRSRLARFGQELHGEKTRLIAFGRYAEERRRNRGNGKPETFDFLGFTHMCGRTYEGKFQLLRQTMRTRLRSKLHALKDELRKRLHEPVPVVGRWLRSVLLGHYRYYGVPTNERRLSAIRFQVYRLWFRSLRRRSQKHRLTWERMHRLAQQWLPKPQLWHPYPGQRLCVNT